MQDPARNLRQAERFLLAPPLSATFGPLPVAVCDISAKGARFRHDRPVETGSKSILQIAVDGKLPVTLEAVIVWTQTDAALAALWQLDRIDDLAAFLGTLVVPAGG